MTDLIKLMSKLVDNRGKILIPGIMNDVTPMTNEEEKIYHEIDFCCNEFRSDVGTEKLIHADKVNTLTHRWRFPSLSLHGIEGAFFGPGSKTVIPKRVVGKFSIRLVPNQEPDKIGKLVTNYLTEEFAKLNSPNKFNVVMASGGRPWMADPKSDNFTAGSRAMKHGKLAWYDLFSIDRYASRNVI